MERKLALIFALLMLGIGACSDSSSDEGTEGEEGAEGTEDTGDGGALEGEEGSEGSEGTPVEGGEGVPPEGGEGETEGGEDGGMEGDEDGGEMEGEEGEMEGEEGEMEGMEGMEGDGGMEGEEGEMEGMEGDGGMEGEEGEMEGMEGDGGVMEGMEGDGGMMEEWPAPPTLGAQIDRMGRPAVNTALNKTFASDEAAKDAAKDAWNSAAQADWGTFKAEIAANLAIYDSLDTNCGNQLLAGPDAVAGRYDTLAGALADDQIYVNTDSSACDVYLAVEANATGLIPNTDCGGRAPKYDVIDVTYSAFAIGAVSGVGDNIDASDNAVTPTFPYLSDPQ